MICYTKLPLRPVDNLTPFSLEAIRMVDGYSSVCLILSCAATLAVMLNSQMASGT